MAKSSASADSSGGVQSAPEQPPFTDYLANYLSERRASNGHDRWLQRLAQCVVAPPAMAPKMGDQAVIYSLHTGRPQIWGMDVSVSVGVAKLLKSGRWGSAREVTNACAPPDSMIDAFSEDDHRLARDLMAITKANDGYFYYRNKPLNGILESGNLLLRIIATGRARSLRAQALTLGPARVAHCQWQCDNDGLWSVAIAVDSAVAVLTCPPVYIDEEHGLCGPLTGIDSQSAQMLHRAPLLPVHEVLAAHRLLSEILPSLPPPDLPSQDVAAPSFAYAVCEGDAILNASSWNGAWEVRAEGLIPLARYGKDWVPLGDQRGSARFGKRIITRDMAAEQYHLQQLRVLGLQPVGGALGFRGPWDHAQSRQLDNLAWLHLGDLTPTSRARVKGPDHLAIPPELLTRLQAGGWQRLLANGQTADIDVVVGEGWKTAIHEREDESWFDVALGLEINGETIDVLPLLRQLAGMGEDAIAMLPRFGDPDQQLVLLSLDERRMVALPLPEVLELYHALIELFTHDGKHLRINKWDFNASEALNRMGSRWQGGEQLLALQRDLKQLAERGMDTVTVSQGFKAQLRPYQVEGLRWLSTLRRMGLGGLLADDMGLGKTVQTLAHLQGEWEAKRLQQPALVIAPVSTLGNWLRECQRFTPDLKVLLYHGPQRQHQLIRAGRHDLLVTSYATLHRDQQWFREQEFSVIICDEAQALKNPSSQQGQAIRALRGQQRLALSGTPMENHLGELWALMQWVEPGLLGSRSTFERLFRNPIEKEGDRARQQALSRRIAPVVLRRRKDAVLNDLPERIDLVHRLQLGKHQAALYESIRAAMDDQVRSAIAAKGIARSKLEFLEALLRLRQICCHPPLVPTRSAQACKESAKLDFLSTLLPELIEEGRRILLFSQFTSLLDHIQSLCARLALPLARLDGATHNRQAAIDRFQNGQVPLFLISLKAGGMGLNLTAADTVILTDPWWNPAVEQQAIDRAHRIGQRNTVFVHRLIISGSVEERVAELQQQKRDLAESLYDADGQSLGTINDEDVKALLNPLDYPE